MLIVDPPDGWSDVQKAAKEVNDTSKFISRHENAAVWFPMLIGPDPADKDGKASELSHAEQLLG